MENVSRGQVPRLDPLAASLAAKIDEQIERTMHLAALVGDVSWRPDAPGAWTFGELLGHLLDCMAGVCAVLYAAYPEKLAHFAALKDLPVNHACGPSEACERAAVYRTHIAEGLAVLRDADLARRVPTLFVPDGEPLMTLLLGNLEHLINHKHQLFLYLRLVPVKVATADLYRFRG